MTTLTSSALPTPSYVEWSAVIAGTILACAVSVVLLQFGSALGLTAMRTLTYAGEHRTWRVIAVGIWLLWTQLMASMAGGYLAGRMRAPVSSAATHEREIRDGAHGLLVWATSMLVTIAAVTVVGFFTAMAAQTGTTPVPDASIPEDFARKSGIIFGFAVAATSVVSGVAAWWMGTVGGDHRDRSPDVSHHISFRRR